MINIKSKLKDKEVIGATTVVGDNMYTLKEVNNVGAYTEGGVEYLSITADTTSVVGMDATLLKKANITASDDKETTFVLKTDGFQHEKIELGKSNYLYHITVPFKVGNVDCGVSIMLVNKLEATTILRQLFVNSTGKLNAFVFSCLVRGVFNYHTATATVETASGGSMCTTLSGYPVITPVDDNEYLLTYVGGADDAAMLTVNLNQDVYLVDDNMLSLNDGSLVMGVQRG